MALSTTNYAEIQQDEIDALKSIYADAFLEKEARIGPWKKAADRIFQIQLNRDVDADGKAALLLHVTFPTTYPRTLPLLKVDYGSEVQQRVKMAAERVVNHLPPTLLGSEMIFDVASALQDVLEKEGEIESAFVPALMEERNAREEALRQEAEAKNEQQKSEALSVAQQQAAQDENELLEQLARKQKARVGKRSANTSHELHPDSDIEEISRGQAFERASMKIKDPSGTIVAIRAVYNKVKIRHSPIANLFLVQSDEASLENSDDAFLALKQCVFEDKIIPSRRSLQDLESTLDRLMHLVDHPSVMRPLNYRIQRSHSDGGQHATHWRISILSELSQKGSLQDLLDLTGTLDPRMAKTWFVQLIEGLYHLHRYGEIHGRIHLGNILLGENEALTTVVKWSDAGYAHSLATIAGPTSPFVPIGWLPVEVTSDTPMQANAAGDIWLLAVCLAQAAFGTDICQRYATPTAFLNDHSMSQSLQHVLHEIFAQGPKRRPSAWDLLHFEFFRNDDGFSDQIDGNALNKVRTRRESEAPADASEYARKFTEEGRLGKGGFGEVFRARNRIDGQLYAVKKIRAASRRALDPVLSETTVLSRLNHPNVVRYFTSWIEEDSTSSLSSKAVFQDSQQSDTLSMSSLSLNPAVLPSSRGLDFISSGHVVFGDPEDAEQSGSDDDSSHDDDSEASSHDNARQDLVLDTKQRAMPDVESTDVTDSGDLEKTVKDEPILLYIQMEYCKQATLRNLLNGGLQSNSTEMWRLFRQIVQGLAHIHAASIVHRDLKPENIFIDDNGDVRIGDFGLARPGEYRAIMPLLEIPKSDSSLTKDIGTGWYVAPEVRSASKSKYDEKVDLFSLGIIFLEMNVVFATGMERAETLRGLAQRRHELPKLFSDPEKTVQARILSSLLQHDPAQRPSCAELLDEIPAAGEDQTVQVVRRELRNEQSQLRSEMIHILFASLGKAFEGQDVSRGSEIKQKMKLLDGAAAMSRKVMDLELQSKVKYELTKIFRRHGAVERTDSPAVFPRHPYYNMSDVVHFLDDSGSLLQLPYDLILPNAMILCRSGRNEPKTFAYGDVYRPDPHKEEANIYGEVDFDITSQTANNHVFQEAETIKVIDEIIDMFPSLSNATMCYHLNHSKLLNMIFEHCNIELGKRFAAKETLSKLNTADWTWPKIRSELRSIPISLSSTSLDDLEQFDWRDSLPKAVIRLRSILLPCQDLEVALSRLSQLVSTLSRLRLSRNIFLSPLSTYNEKFYRDNVFFQCLYDRKRRAVFAAGGRYDSLIRDNQVLISREAPIHGVGFQMSWSGLSTSLLTYLNAQAKSKGKRRPLSDKLTWTTRRCDVIVDCYDQALLEDAGVKILADLWANQISAELARPENLTTASTFVRASPIKEEHNWTVLLKSSELAKVRNAKRQDETEVRVTEIASHMRAEIRERNRNEGRQIPNPLSRTESQPEKMASAHGAEVKVLMSQTKGKKTNRKTIVEEALTQAQEWRKTSMDDPIIAIEVKDEIFWNLQNTNLSDPDTWKKVIQTAAAGDRQYLAQIQAILQEQEGKNGAFLYNFRSKAMLHYTLH